MRKVALIIGSAYSGSSLLTALFDQFSTCYAIGESRQVFQGKVDGPCWKCGTSTAECSEWSQWDGEPFFPWLFDRIDQDFVVDSSKKPKWCIDEINRTPGFECEYRAIVLSKSVKEQIASFWNHQNWSGSNATNHEPEKWVDIYISCYRNYLEALRDQNIPFVPITYEMVARFPRRTMKDLFRVLEVPDDRGGELSHTLGGNPAIISAISGNDELAFGPSGRAGYLDGKYEDRGAGDFRIRYDNGWPELPDWVRHAVNQRMKQRRRDLRSLACLLGHE